MGVQDDGEDWRSRHKAEGDLPARSTDRARAHEPGRGREADAPEEIPARGWKDVAWRILFAISEDRILSTSGGVAFFVLLSVFPAIATVVSLYGLVADAGVIPNHLSLFSGIFPAGVLDLIENQITLVAGQSGEALGVVFLASLVIALWSANSGMAALFDALNVIYKEREKRSFVCFYAMTLMVTFIAIGLIAVATFAAVILPALLRAFGTAGEVEALLRLLRWPVLLGILIVALACIYRYGPSRENAKWRWVSWGSFAATLLWLGTSMLFSWYVVNFDSYNRLYGSLGAAIGFMTWIWLSAVTVLLGAELNAEMEHQTARDSTTGRPQPLGARGAQMADHVGQRSP